MISRCRRLCYQLWACSRSAECCWLKAVLTASTVNLRCLISPGTSPPLHGSNIHARIISHHMFQVAFANYWQPLQYLNPMPPCLLWSRHMVCCISQDRKTPPQTQLLQFFCLLHLSFCLYILLTGKKHLFTSHAFFHLSKNTPLLSSFPHTLISQEPSFNSGAFSRLFIF